MTVRSRVAQDVTIGSGLSLPWDGSRPADMRLGSPVRYFKLPEEGTVRAWILVSGAVAVLLHDLGEKTLFKLDGDGPKFVEAAVRSERVRFTDDSRQLCWCACAVATGHGILGVERFERTSADPVWREILDWTRDTWTVVSVMES